MKTSTVGPYTQAPQPSPDPGPSVTPPLWYGVPLQGTYTDLFDLNMATNPGLGAPTHIGELQAALAYWNNIVSLGGAADPYLRNLAPTAVTWLTNEIARVQTPPLNTLSIVYPV